MNDLVIQETDLQTVDKEIIESYKLAFSRCNYNFWEKRIIYNMLRSELLQTESKQSITDKKNNVPHPEFNLFGDVTFRIPLNAISDSPNDYKNIKDGLNRLLHRSFTFESEEYDEGTHFIMRYRVPKYKGIAEILMSGDIFKSLVDMSHGFRRINFGVAMSLRSNYAMRFYEMFCYQHKNTNNGIFIFKISELRDMMCKGKYERAERFITKVVKTAKDELDKVANFSFDYTPKKSGNTRGVDLIEFKVYHIPENEANISDALKENRLLNRLAEVTNISKYLYEELQNLGFLVEDIHANKATFFICEQSYIYKYGKQNGTDKLLEKIDEIKERGLRSGKSNINGYIVNALKSDEHIMNEERRQAKLQAYAQRKLQEEEQQFTNN